jgi:hypothetical protein
MMKKLLFSLLALAIIAVPINVAAQGDLSAQVLRLLSRVNTWTAQNTYDAPNGGIIILGRQDTPLMVETDTLENIGGNLYFNGAHLTSAIGAGTVTSVGLTLPAIFGVSGSPVTSSGSLTATLATQTANRIFSGPTTGSPAAPTFRALVAADIPDISATYLTPSSTATLTNKSGAISQWTNDSGYITNSVTTLSGLVSIGVVTTGTWHGTVLEGQYGGTGVANTGMTLTLGGNVTFSGSNNVTFTTVGVTAVTLPTTGTILTTSATTLSSLTSIGTVATGAWQATPIDVPYGGTNLTSISQGDLLYGSAPNVYSKLSKNTSSTRVLCNTGSSNNPAWCQVDLTTGVTGTLPGANGGLGVSTAAVTDGQLLIGQTSDHTLGLAAITGTANQIIVTNGGHSITLSTPQSIATASTPQFARLGLGVGAGGSAVITTTGQVNTGYYDNGSSGGAGATIDWSNGMTQKILLTGNPTFTFNNPIVGVPEYRLDLIQDGTGTRTVTWPGTLKWQGGSAPTLTTTVNKADVCLFRWNGTNYYGVCSLNY